MRPSVAAERVSMSTPAVPPSSPQPPSTPAGARVTPTPPAPPHAGEGLDLEEDVAPNLGGEDQMQDA
jgi:hypothetical protein